MWWIEREFKESWYPNDPLFTMKAIFTGVIYYGTIGILVGCDKIISLFPRLVFKSNAYRYFRR